MSNSLGKYNISSYIDDLVPDHVESSYPDLVNFLKTYALYLERSNESAFYLNSLDIQRDIDHVEENLLTELQNEIGIAVPRDFATNPRTFYKHLIEFYRSRGTPESITSFFRVIYDDEVETYFPFVDLLVPSDGNWTDQAASVIRLIELDLHLGIHLHYLGHRQIQQLLVEITMNGNAAFLR